MSTNGNIVFGHLDDVRLTDFVDAIGSPPASLKFALITCLDSCFDVSGLLLTSKHLEPLRGAFEELGSGLVISTTRLLKAHQQAPVFFGFDEVFFFSKRPTRPKPATFSLVGPSPTSPDSSAKARRWFIDTSCYLGLGDGTGLNFMARMVGRIPEMLVNTVAEPVLIGA